MEKLPDTSQMWTDTQISASYQPGGDWTYQNPLRYQSALVSADQAVIASWEVPTV